jgi:hypothetical protein
VTTEPDCVYEGCEDPAKVIREVVQSGRELTYCREHDPLREDSDVQWAFKER